MLVQIKDKKERERVWESYCDPGKGCGTACCFFNGSPCTELEFLDPEKKIGRCRIYDKRFGRRKTIKGDVFQCVPIHVYMQFHSVPARCGYEGIEVENHQEVY